MVDLGIFNVSENAKNKRKLRQLMDSRTPRFVLVTTEGKEKLRLYDKSPKLV